MLDTVAKNIQAIFPDDACHDFRNQQLSYAAPASVSTEQKWFGRFDADITSNNRLTGSSAYNYPTTFTATGIVYPVNVTVVDVENMSGQISDVHTFSSRTINEARAGWMGEYDLLTSPTSDKGWPAKLGMQYGHADIYPTINITNYLWPWTRPSRQLQREYLQRVGCSDDDPRPPLSPLRRRIRCLPRGLNGMGQPQLGNPRVYGRYTQEGNHDRDVNRGLSLRRLPAGLRQ